jgi:hypothetical protein
MSSVASYRQPVEQQTTRKGWLSCIINDRVSLRYQLLISFTVVTIVAGGITLGICLGMLIGLGNDTYSNADNIILDSSRSNVKNIGIEVANTINQELTTISQSLASAAALYGKNLINSANLNYSNQTLLKPMNSYPEFHFAPGCTGLSATTIGGINDGTGSYCPSDYGPIYSRSRIPFLAAYQEGSMDSTSIYLYSSGNGGSFRNDSSWQSTFSAYPEVLEVVNALDYEDIDFKEFYTNGPKSTLMFYLSAQVYDSSQSSYHAIHRTYPGMVKNDSAYDPSKRSWFKNAPFGGVNFYGPYKETFTRQYVVTVSSKQIFNYYRKSSSGNVVSTHPVNIVAAAVILLKDLQKIVQDIQYTYNGFGAIITTSGNSVLVWGDQDTDSLYNPDTGSFKVLSEIDPELGRYINGGYQGDLEYTDAQGKDWMVSVKPFFPSGTVNSLMMLVFAESSVVKEPLAALRVNIDDTTSSVTINIVVIICATIGGIMLLTLFLVAYITSPLERMRQISHDLIAMAGEDEDKRDYTDILRKAYDNISRSDEVGTLASEYYHVIVTLQSNLMRKRAVVKYPINPFYLIWPSANRARPRLDWDNFYNIFFNQWKLQHPVLSSIAPIDKAGDSAAGDLDVLASLTRSLVRPSQVLSNAVKTSTPYNPASVDSDNMNSSSHHSYSVVPMKEDDIELGGVPEASIKVKDEKDDSSTRGSETSKNARFKPYYPLGTNVNQVNDGRSLWSKELRRLMEDLPKLKISWLSSIKSKLILLSALLLAGLFIALIITILTLKSEGDSWMNDTTDDLNTSQYDNLNAVAEIKSGFVKVSDNDHTVHKSHHPLTLNCSCCYLCYCSLFSSNCRWKSSSVLKCSL